MIKEANEFFFFFAFLPEAKKKKNLTYKCIGKLRIYLPYIKHLLPFCNYPYDLDIT